MSRTLQGRRVVVAGASAGIGRAFAARALADGARVVAAGRREERLRELGDVVPVACDLSTDEGARALAAAAGAEFGEIDLLVNAVGVAPLRVLADATREDWLTTLQTNVVGVNELLQQCLGLLHPASLVALLSSEVVGQERPSLNVYAASKAALEQLIVGWRTEYPAVRFSRIVVGSTIDTEFGRAFDDDHELFEWTLNDWMARGLLPSNYMLSDDVAEVLLGSLATALDVPSVSLESLSLRPPGATMGTTLAPSIAARTPSDS